MGIIAGLKRLFAKAFIGGEWKVAYRARDVHDGQYRIIDMPEGTWAADPFLLEVNGEHFLFVELFEKKSNKACIGCCKFVDGKPVYQGKVIEQPYHMSYPCVFEHNGIQYMIPETSANKSVDLYRAVVFPLQWEKAATLLSGERYVDTTVVCHEGCLFAVSYRKDRGCWSLDLFALDMESMKLKQLTSSRFPSNTGRPGGSFCCQNGLFRPAQDCRQKYGHELILYEVEQIGPQGFSETEKNRIRAGDLPLPIRAARVHTFNQDDLYECIDVFAERFDLLHGIKIFRRAFLKRCKKRESV